MRLNEPKHYFHSLDSLRGIAALMVLLQHLWEMNHVATARLKPWLFFYAGHEAVILFFVLSGFVLTHQLRYFKFSEYPQFILKRYLRIYPAYYAALIFSAFIWWYTSNYHRSNLNGFALTKWFYIWSQTSFDKTMFLGSLTLLSHEGNSLNFATWSLFYEMWLSLLFPVLWWLLSKAHVLIRLLTSGLLCSLSYYCWKYGAWLDNSWQGILYYSWYFLAGMLLYYWHGHFKFLSNWFCLVIGLILYFSNFLFFNYFTSRFVHECVIGVACLLILLNALYNQAFITILTRPVWQFYGKISYSLYLFHLPVMYLLGYCFLAAYGIVVVKIAIVAISSVLALISYYTIELGGINLAKSLVMVWRK